MVTVSNVANASRGELLCITYELLLEQIRLCEVSKSQKERQEHVQHGVEILKMLAEDLNFEYELSRQLLRIYIYVQGLLLKGRHKADFEEAYKLIDKIYSAYKTITEKEEDKTPVMQNSENVYAGLTYGKNSINELSVEDPNRGFKA